MTSTIPPQYAIAKTARWLILLFGLMLMLRVTAEPALAATFTVTSGADSGANTLRQAVADAAANSTANDVINVNVGAITLDSEIVIGEPLFINLNGATVNLSGAAPGRIFNINAGLGGTTTIRRGTLTGRNAAFTGDGGVIASSGSRVIFDAVTIQNGVVDGLGGGVYLTGTGFYTFQNSTITTNTARAGGGIYATVGARVFLTQSNITNNNLGATFAGTTPVGAGIAAFGGLIAEGSTISTNGANLNGAHQGGGVYAGGGAVIINRTTINNNTATRVEGGIPARGGGVYIFNNPDIALIIQSSVHNNTAHQGGGAYSTVTLDVANSTFHANNAVDTAASADEGGGAIFVAGGQLVSTFVTYDNNTATPNTARASIAVVGATAYLRNNIFSVSAPATGNCYVSGGTLVDRTGNLETTATCNFAAGDMNIAAGTIFSGAWSGGVRPINRTGTAATEVAADKVATCTYPPESDTSAELLTARVGAYGPNIAPAVDQRNVPRPQPTGGACDIGAYEVYVSAASAGVSLVLNNSNEAIPFVQENQTVYAEYAVRLTNQPTGNVTLALTTNDGQIQLAQNATLGAALNLTFTPDNWAITQYFRVYGTPDTTVEADPHISGFTLDPAGPGDYNTLANLTRQIFVIDDDSDRTISINDVTALDNAGSMTFTVTLNDTANPLTGTDKVTFQFFSQNETAIAGVDYVAVSGTREFTATGPRTLTIPVTINQDTDTLTETFLLRLTNVVGARISGNRFGRGTISENNTGAASGGAFNILPETLATGKVGTPYSVTFSASGGVAPYKFTFDTLGNTLVADNFNFDTNTGILTFTPTAEQNITVRVTSTDAVNQTAFRQYVLEVTLTGVSASATATPGPTNTPNFEQLQLTRVADVRVTLGPPTLQIDPRYQVPGVYIYTGPAIGATILNVARPDNVYPILGEYREFGDEFSWYLIEFPVRDESGNPLETVNPEGTPIPNTTQRGWIYGELMLVGGYVPDIPRLSNPFNGVSLSNTETTGQTLLKNNIYRYPTPNSALVAQFDEGTTFQILGRTRVDQREITNWILIRLDQGGQVGWMKYAAPYVTVDGDLTRIPTY